MMNYEVRNILEIGIVMFIKFLQIEWLGHTHRKSEDSIIKRNLDGSQKRKDREEDQRQGGKPYVQRSMSGKPGKKCQ